MALKLGKCRLCLKLGDFYSIFTVDNSLQLAEMVMECTQVKVYEGDGLPDKICSECIQKLSGAYIFKQQCERSDQELRRNYVPPPGFHITTPPPNRQSSDSAFSNHTDISNQTYPSKPPSSNEKVTPAPRVRKRSRESIDNGSVSSQSEYKPSSSKRINELRNSSKKPKHSSDNSMMDSDYDDNSVSRFSCTDSDEPLMKTDPRCNICDKTFKTLKSLGQHKRIHTKEIFNENTVDTPQNNDNTENDDEDRKLGCEKCGKTFKLKIMLKRHAESCNNSPLKAPTKTPAKPTVKSPVMPHKELMISLEPIVPISTKDNRLKCGMCSGTYKNMDSLAIHMKMVHGGVLKREKKKKISVPCLYCGIPFDDCYAHNAHVAECPLKADLDEYVCRVCNKSTSRRPAYISHVKKTHFDLWGYDKYGEEAANLSPAPAKSSSTSLECRMCSERLPSQEALVQHLSEHMNSIQKKDSDGGQANNDDDSRASFDNDADDGHDPDDAEDDEEDPSDNFTSTRVSTGPLSCKICNKHFKYKKALESHEDKHAGEPQIKLEPQEKSFLREKGIYRESDSESSQDGEDLTCDICEKMFSYKRLLIHHKRTKHNMSSGHKRAKITLKDCTVRCLICDIEMKVSEINEHNQKHIAVNIKPRNMYTCIECGEKFKSCTNLATHIKLVHRLKQLPPKPPPALADGAELADFCEVVVTKTEPLDDIQSHNDFGEEVPDQKKKKGKSKSKKEKAETKPIVNLTGFTCPTCGKKMPTLISLKRHTNWHENVGNNIEQITECFVCNEKFRFKGHYKLHMKAHYQDPNIDPKFLTCSICQRKSKHLRAAMMHMNFHKQTRFQSKDYQCSICKKVFQYRKVYLSHMAVHFKKGESGQNAIIGSQLPNNADRTIYDGSNTCHLCGKICESEQNLKHHLIWHNSKGLLYAARHECHLCDLTFTNKHRLTLHIRTHYEDDNGPYKCHICGKGYTDETYCQKHIKGHNFDHQVHKKRIEKLRKDKVKCPICIRYYPDLLRLIRHIKFSHPNSKMIKEDPDAPPPNLFSCKLCARVFQTERRLRNHEESHTRTKEKMYCKFCGRSAHSLKLLNIHIKGHLTKKYLDNPLKCSQCDETFTKGYDLHHHLRDVHQIQENWISDHKEVGLEGPLKEFQCSVCYKILASKGNYERHIDYHNTLRCNYCYELFSKEQFLEGHLQFSCEKKKLIGDTELLVPKKVKCGTCYKAFHLQVKLDCHLRTQHNIKTSREARQGDQEIVCDYCFRVFENEEALVCHKTYHRTIGYYGCLYCKRKFNTMTLYRKHKNHHFSQLNVDNPTKCEHCDETFVAFRDMIYHMRDDHNDDKEWVVMPKEVTTEMCHICNKMIFNLPRHLDYHEANRCKKCGEYFFSSVDFDNHLCSIESDDEPEADDPNDIRPKYIECPFCFKQITKSKSLKLHAILHKTSGAISCRFCDHKFKTMDAFSIHAFSHRSKKYIKRRLKCKDCGEKFIKYGPFMKHLKQAHKITLKMHYRAIIKPERCVICGDDFPNLHNHYRHHLLHQCQSCNKYFTSSKVFSKHECGKEDSDPSKVFESDANLQQLINSYVPRDEKDDEKFFGPNDVDEEEDEPPEEPKVTETKPFKPKTAPNSQPQADINDEDSQASQLSQNTQHSMDIEPEVIQQPFVISDVLSLSMKKEHLNNRTDESKDNEDIVNLIDDDDVDFHETVCPIIEIDD